MAGRIHLSKADVSTLEEEYVVAAIRSGWCAPLGPDVDAFEAEIAAFVGRRARTCPVVGHRRAPPGPARSGRRARPGRRGPDDDVCGDRQRRSATPVRLRCSSTRCARTPTSTRALLVEAVDTLRAEGADVCAVVTVDLFGRCADYAAIEPASAERGVPLVEDAAEALGATRGGRSGGRPSARAAVLSFNGNKIMTTSGGGMLLSNDGELVAHARKLSTQAREPVPWYEHLEIGYNYRLSNLLAAFGRAQLARLPGMIERRRAIRQRYATALEPTGAELLGGPDGEDNCWLTAVVLPSGCSPTV